MQIVFFLQSKGHIFLSITLMNRFASTLKQLDGALKLLFQRRLYFGERLSLFFDLVNFDVIVSYSLSYLSFGSNLLMAPLLCQLLAGSFMQYIVTHILSYSYRLLKSYNQPT